MELRVRGQLHLYYGLKDRRKCWRGKKKGCKIKKNRPLYKLNAIRIRNLINMSAHHQNALIRQMKYSLRKIED